MKKRFVSQIFVVVLICIIASLGYIKTDKMQSAARYYEDRIIIIDAGHGGFDGGAVAVDGTVEKDINLKISNKLSTLLKLEGFNVIMTRCTDTATDTVNSEKISTRKKSDMANRLELTEKYPNAVFVSVHLNKFTTTSANGAQVFYGVNNKESRELGQSIQESIKTLIQPENERCIKKGTKSTYLLYNSKIPSCIVECGFLSNKNELTKLKDDGYQTCIAIAINKGILNFYNG